MTIKLIVGLGNPGKDYQFHRHNVGFWFVEQINQAYNGQFKSISKFLGKVSKITINNNDCWLLKPDTFINLSGQSVRVFADFYKINTDEILVLHDELDLAAGVIRLKTSGGANGHNGLKDIIGHSDNHFHRLRIGINRPIGTQNVVDYVLSEPNADDKIKIQNAISRAQKYIPDIVALNLEKAMNELHKEAENGL